MKMASAAFLCLFLISALPGDAHGQAAPSGFSGSVSAQAYSEHLEVLFLGEKNGYLCAYDVRKAQITARCRIAPYPVAFIACHPQNGELSIVASDGSSRHSAIFLDYSDGEFYEFKREELEEKPESLVYSPKGGLLAISALSARGIILKDTVDYSTIDGFSRSCGPSSFTAIGSSEKSILQYAPQGRIIYRSIPQGAIIQENKTFSNLSGLSLSGDKKSVFGLNQGSFVSLDSQNGTLLFSIPMKNLSCYSMPDQGGVSIFCLDTGKYQEIDLVTRKVPSAYLQAVRPFASILRAGNVISALDRSGSLYLAAALGELKALPSDPFLAVQFAQPFRDSGESGYLFCAPGMICFVSENDLLLDDPETPVTVRTASSSLSGMTAASSLGSSFHAAATQDGRSEIRSFSGLSGGFLKIPLDSPSQVTRLNSGAFGIIAIQANGGLLSVDSGTAKRLISVNGVLDAAAISPGRIAIGKARGGSLAAPLLFYSMAKGEVAPAPLEAIAVIRIIPSGKDSFIALCVENGEKGVMTSIREIAYGPFSNRLIMSVPGERIGLQLALGAEGAVYYAFDDVPSIFRLSKDQEQDEWPLADLPVSLSVGESSLCVLHADGSISVIGFQDKKTSRFAMGIGSMMQRLER